MPIAIRSSDRVYRYDINKKHVRGSDTITDTLLLISYYDACVHVDNTTFRDNTRNIESIVNIICRTFIEAITHVANNDSVLTFFFNIVGGG